MINFFKNFGKGILYVLVLPLLLLALAGYAIVALFIFLFLAIKGLVLFFSGRSLYEDLPEDIEAKKRLGTYKEETNQPESVVLTEEANNETPQDDLSADPFYVPEYLKQETQNEKAFEEEPSVSEPEEPKVMLDDEYTNEAEDLNSPVFEEKKVINPDQVEEDEVISLEKSSQNATILDINEIEDDEDEENNSGIDIDFN